MTLGGVMKLPCNGREIGRSVARIIRIAQEVT